MLAAFADGAKDDTEREEIRRIAQSLAAEGNMPDLPRLYQDVLLRRTSLESAAAAARPYPPPARLRNGRVRVRCGWPPDAYRA
jgi:hypothetical protein